MKRASCCIDLPENFRTDDFLAFHRRDSQEIAEKVSRRELRKGMIWRGHPACLTIRLDERLAEAELRVDGVLPDSGPETLRAMVHRMLGLAQPVEVFEQTYREHPQLGPLIAGQPGLRVPVTATPFEALTWAVMGQAISVNAAVSLRRKLILLAGVRHSSGLFCYPEAQQIALLGEDHLRRTGFSTAKARTLLTLSRLVLENRLPLDQWLQTLPVEEMQQRLQKVRGIGPWTISYVLLRGFGWLDGSLHGDVAVRKGLQTLLDSPDKVGMEQTRQWLAPFSPWRALVAAHLWKQQM
jgi:DNA-3-methyladenine glycosylase II